MAIHDWSRLDAGFFRDFHNAWHVFIREALNGGLLPPEYYAITEQAAGNILTDVLTLHAPIRDEEPRRVMDAGMLPVATMPPKVRLQMTLPRETNVPIEKQLTIRHVTSDRIVAIVEIVSQGNKSSRTELDRFVLKATEAIRQGIHLLIVDTQAPTIRDPHGIHWAICEALGDSSYTAPPEKPLTLVSYVGMSIGTAYVEPVATGVCLLDMPLFLDEGSYVNVPLEETYQRAFQNFPRPYKRVLEQHYQV